MSPRTCSQWAQAPIRVQRLYGCVCVSTITRLQTRLDSLHLLQNSISCLLNPPW